jgi:hypothetical protein
MAETTADDCRASEETPKNTAPAMPHMEIG